MWVGATVAPNKTEDVTQYLDDLRNSGWTKGAGPTALVSCPWCGHDLDPAATSRSIPTSAEPSSPAETPGDVAPSPRGHRPARGSPW
jgi:hypothetical protein